MQLNGEQERGELLTLSMGKLFRKLAIPGMMGMIVVGLYTLMDAIFVGQLIGKEAVGAVALAYFKHHLKSSIYCWLRTRNDGVEWGR